MPTYVYACTKDPAHDRKEVVHSMLAVVDVFCPCGAKMRRVPQRFHWGHSAIDSFINHWEKKYEDPNYRRSIGR